jgi:hypothetical protein
MISSEVDLDILINNFRLLELAGAADQIAHQRAGSLGAQLWLRYAQTARNYHAWIARGDFDSGAFLGISDIGGDFTRIISEIASWAPEGSYLHFLGAYEAMASLDGERMIRELKAVVERLDPAAENVSLDRARAYFAALDSPNLPAELISSYEVMQIVADILGPALGLKNHAFEDIQRFALRPGFAVTQAEPPG